MPKKKSKGRFRRSAASFFAKPCADGGIPQPQPQPQPMDTSEGAAQAPAAAAAPQGRNAPRGLRRTRSEREGQQSWWGYLSGRGDRKRVIAEESE